MYLSSTYISSQRSSAEVVLALLALVGLGAAAADALHELLVDLAALLQAGLAAFFFLGGEELPLVGFPLRVPLGGAFLLLLLLLLAAGEAPEETEACSCSSDEASAAAAAGSAPSKEAPPPPWPAAAGRGEEGRR